MSADGADRSSELTQFRSELRTLAITRKALALGRSVGTPLYLISLGLIATWIIGVFFGVGFFFLVHHSEKQLSGSGAGDRSHDVNAESAASASSPRLATGWPVGAAEGDPEDAGGRIMDQPIALNQAFAPPSAEAPQRLGGEAGEGLGDRNQPLAAPGAENTLGIEGPSLAQAELAINQSPTDRESPGPTVEPLTLWPLDNPGRGRPLPSEAAVPSTVKQSTHPDPARERHQRRPSATAAPRPHAPLQAIRDLLQKYAHLLE